MDDYKNKTGVYASRAVEVASVAGGELERRDFGKPLQFQASINIRQNP